MSKSIADLRAEKSTLRPRRIYRAVVGDGQKYVAETQQLTGEMETLQIKHAAIEEAEQQKPRKTGEGVSPDLTAIRERVEAIKARLAELADLMGEYDGDLTVEATKSDGDWEQWRIANPARGEDEPGHRDDLVLTGGHCNSDALIADLAAYVVAWNGEPLGPGDFEALNLLRPDKKVIAAMVDGLYETGDDLPKWLAALSGHRKSAQSSPSPSE